MPDIRVAVIGLRHPHIFEIHDKLSKAPGVEVVAVCEEHAPTREALGGRIRVTHDSVAAAMDLDCDAVAVGDAYGRRGAIVIEALRRGRHVLADKPICTALSELQEIAALARGRRLALGCPLGNRWSGNFLRLRRIIADGGLGRIHQIAFGGQHPLNYGSRPSWYFEPGMHGGTINDIAVHATANLPWLTGRSFASCLAARCWNAFATQEPHFEDSAQMLLAMDDGCGVMGDVSYAMPRRNGYTLPQYWRYTVFGSKGIAETWSSARHVWIADEAEDSPRELPGLDVQGSYVSSFLAEIRGDTTAVSISTDEVLTASEVALRIQEAAEQGIRDASLRSEVAQVR